MSEHRSGIGCRRCEAENAIGATTCWLCGQDLTKQDRLESTAPEIHPGQGIQPAAEFSKTFALSSMFLVITLIAVLLGLLVTAPGLGILLAIVSFPAVVRTGVVAGRRAELGRPVSAMQKTLLFLGSLSIAVVVVTVVAVTSIGTFCAVCLSAGTEKAIPFALLCAAITTGSAIAVIVKLLRARWRHQRGQDTLKNGPAQ